MRLGMKGRFGRLLACAAALSLTACAAGTGETAPAASAAASAPARPAMWRVADEDTTIYLFGTIHTLPKGKEWRTPAMESALASADELVLEIANVDDPMAMAGVMMRLGMSPNLPPLRERVPEARRAALDEIVKASGVPAAALDRFETWAAALTLFAVTLQRMGLDPELGVENRLTAQWKPGGKPIRGLETVEEQFGFFDRLSEASQRAFLVSVLDPAEEASKEFAAMLDAWSRGDEKAIARTFDDEASMSPELREALLGKRNAKWAQWLDDRLDRPGTAFVAVGAGHLAGRDSVQAKLKARGIASRRVQ